jgi:uncharacterized protein with NRDE domain
MCLVLLAHRVHPGLPLIVAANRDEFHARPAQKMHWWVEKPDIIAGRDLQAGGTWLGVHKSGRFATVTNFRDALPPSGRRSSRGHLVTEFLESDRSPLDFVRSIDGGRYAGFNLLVADREELAYLSNRDGASGELPPGIYGVANATLDTPWPKVERTKAELERLIANANVNESELLRLLEDRRPAPARDVESGRLPFEKAHALSAPFIVLPDYGTRCTTVLTRDTEGRVRISERRFSPDGRSTGQSDFNFQLAT